MRFVASEPDLPKLIVPRRHSDERGWFSETFHEQRLSDVGITCHFVQDNRSRSRRSGTLRGLDFQLPPAAQAKLVCVLRGRILDVAVDIRSGSPTYGTTCRPSTARKMTASSMCRLDSRTGSALWRTMSKMMYKVSNYYAPALDGGICWHDTDIGFRWPVAASDLIVSEKDGRLPALKDFVSPFAYDGHPLMPLGPAE
jgi:dTDP-4-dehydrorhamnose 3,5-epimerase